MERKVKLVCFTSWEEHIQMTVDGGRLDWTAVKEAFCADVVEIKDEGVPSSFQAGEKTGLTRRTFDGPGYQDEADVSAYADQYLYQPLGKKFPLPGFTEPGIQKPSQVSDMFGQPDFVATAFNSASQQKLLFVAVSKTHRSFVIPYGSSTADAYQDPNLQQNIGGVDQVGDCAASKRSLADLQHETAVYKHLRAEQGVSVPRLVARGYMIDSSLYFVATEPMGPSLELAPIAERNLEPAAMHALERVHACGVLHGDVRPANFLQCGRKGVVLDWLPSQGGVQTEGCAAYGQDVAKTPTELVPERQVKMVDVRRLGQQIAAEPGGVQAQAARALEIEVLIDPS
ncbi:hypothetical protein WJX74_000027 [Apatococcus lobatus]|uniref:Protein kinase domain-containing protein n=1 Tax=Apatococcus lobatus TaxID=904363 RepID=A0AAW1QMQ2_9CHLO